jgi:PAS domain-containing protein
LCLLLGPAATGAVSLTPLQGNLLAQCITALLVGSSVTWIRVNEERYRQVVGHIPVVLYSARLAVLPAAGEPARVEITFVSPACWTLLGRDAAALEGDYERWIGRVHHEDRELLLAALAQLCLAQRPVTCEYRLVSVETPAGGDGEGRRERASITTPRWVRDTLVPHVNPQGQVEGWEGVVEDITSQRVLANDLRRTSNMLHALVSNLPAGVFFVQGPTGQPLLVNARARQLLGQREDGAAGLAHLPQVYRLFRPDGSPYPADELPVAQALSRSLTSMRDDIVVHRPDGRRIPLVSWAAPVELSGQGKADAAVWVLEDLTVLRRAEAAREGSEARLRAVISSLAEGLIVQDARGLIVECNPAACTILGTSAEELQGQAFPGTGRQCFYEDGSLVAPDDQPALASLRTGKPIRDAILRIGWPADSQDESASGFRWVRVNTIPVPSNAEEKQRYVVTTLADITAHRQALWAFPPSDAGYRALVENLR